MKILYCIAFTSNSGGMERILTDKVNYLSDKLDYDISIVTTDQKGDKPFYPLSPKVKTIDIGVNYRELKNLPFIKKVLKFREKTKLHKKKLKKLINETRPDIIVSLYGNESYFLNKINGGSKTVLEIHFSRYFRKQMERKNIWKYVDKFKDIRDAWKIKKFDRFVVLTEEDKGYWGNTGNITVIPNFVKVYAGMVSDLNKKNVLAVGRISHQKGYDLLLKIWEIASVKNPDWTLTIIGNDSGNGEREKLLVNIKEMNLEKSVIVKDPTDKIELEYIYSSVYVLPSRYEGLPLVLLEAMKHGLPSVCFECKCGPRDVITDKKDGFLVEEGNVEVFAHRLMELMESYELRKSMSSAAIEKEKTFDEDAIMNKWKELFEKL
ncbi:MAG: glycosyltransferase family 4 protein [Rikenellaceae bacterium]|nr:glycosyltransferase family 4 protein [Rikenellaceae bacterium]